MARDRRGPAQHIAQAITEHIGEGERLSGPDIVRLKDKSTPKAISMRGLLFRLFVPKERSAQSVHAEIRNRKQSGAASLAVLAAVSLPCRRCGATELTHGESNTMHKYIATTVLPSALHLEPATRAIYCVARQA